MVCGHHVAELMVKHVSTRGSTSHWNGKLYK